MIKLTILLFLFLFFQIYHSLNSPNIFHIPQLLGCFVCLFVSTPLFSTDNFVSQFSKKTNSHKRGSPPFPQHQACRPAFVWTHLTHLQFRPQQGSCLFSKADHLSAQVSLLVDILGKFSLAIISSHSFHSPCFFSN